MNRISIGEKEIRCFSSEEISAAVRELFISANYVLPESVCRAEESFLLRERDPLARNVLSSIIENTRCAREMNIPVCQDTGMAVLFAEIGREVYLDCDFEFAVNEGVKLAYTEGYLRKSIVRDPLYDRTNTGDNTPALIHVSFDPSEEMKGKLRLTAAPKGFGSENMSRQKMLTPSCTEDDVISFVKESVVLAGSNPCPPIFVGVGIGSDFEGVCLLAKKALLRDEPSADERYRALEERLLREINELGIGPQGFGGDTTALGVYIETAPTHIAGLPVAVNINCHVARHRSVVLS